MTKNAKRISIFLKFLSHFCLWGFGALGQWQWYTFWSLRGNRETVLEAVKQHGRALDCASEECKGDHELVMAAVQQDGYALKFAAANCQGESAIVLAAVMQSGTAIQYAAKDFARDREIVLVAVKQNGRALQFAEEPCSSDREIVLAAVRQYGPALVSAAEECKGEREIASAAVEQDVVALMFVSDELLLDTTFAKEAKQLCFILKICMISGRCIYVVSKADNFNTAEEILIWCCEEFGIEDSDTTALVSGVDIVPIHANVQDWP
eukprot:3609283-Amphidinium_carterae.1